MEPSKKSHKKLVWRLAIVAVVMFGFAYALVPLYTLVCKQAGLNGRTGNQADLISPDLKVDKTRSIDVTFVATRHGDFNFIFKPLIRHVSIHPGEQKLVYFYAENKTGHGITVQAIPSVMPDEGARYFKKTQCFCFTQQYFFAGEKADMPVYFYINPKISKDITSMSLSYTLFDASLHLKKDQKQYRKGRIEIKG